MTGLLHKWWLFSSFSFFLFFPNFICVSLNPSTRTPLRRSRNLELQVASPLHIVTIAQLGNICLLFTVPLENCSFIWRPMLGIQRHRAVDEFSVCHAYCDTGHPFLLSFLKDLLRSHLLPSGIRPPDSLLARRTLLPTAPPPWQPEKTILD